MTWSSDPALQQMFIDEVTERSARLVEGAQALRAGSISPYDAGDLLREGHTIKGTGRVMGYDDVADAGLMLELLWRWIQHEDIAPTPELGRDMESLSASIPGALADPGSLAASMSAIHTHFESGTTPEDLPAAPAVDGSAVRLAQPSEPEQAVAASLPVPAGDAEDTIIRFDRSTSIPVASPGGSDSADVSDTDELSPDDDRVAAPVSAQAAFAELRRSMESGGVEDVPAADQRDVAPDTTDTGSIGAVIEFPGTGAMPGGQSGQQRVIRHDRVDEDPQSDRDEVVVLPSSGSVGAGSSIEATDLGGLLGAVQSWASEDTLSINAGRLYGLVNHIVSLRMDVASVSEELDELVDVAASDPLFAERISAIADGIETIARAAQRIEGRALGLAAAPLQDVTNTLPQLGRYLSRKTGKEVRVEMIGDDVLVDRQVLDRIGDSLRQIVVNAVVHGIEGVDERIGAGKSGTGVVRIEAHKTDVNLEVSVTDDGRGVDWGAIRSKGQELGLLDADAELSPEALRALLYRPGFSTSASIDELGGDGAGLAKVREAVEAMNGSLTIDSSPGKRTEISLIVPLHQAMQKALLIVSGGIMWGIPETGVRDVIDMNLATITVTDEATILERSDGDIPFASFADLMGLRAQGVPTSIVVVADGVGSLALGVEQVMGVRRVAAKELGAVLTDAEAVTGAALLGGEEVVLLLDPVRLAERQRDAANGTMTATPGHVLIVDDSRGVQQVVSSALATSGFNTSVAASVADALGALQSEAFDAIVVDFSMPRADGVALAHMVRQRHGDIPMVMLSGVAEGEDVDRARDAGVDAFFGKSDFREGGLAETLRQLIAARRAREQSA